MFPLLFRFFRGASFLAASVAPALFPADASARTYGRIQTLHEFSGTSAFDSMSSAARAVAVAGSVNACAGAAGALLWQFDGSTVYGDFGGSVDCGGDLNGDGKADFCA